MQKILIGAILTLIFVFAFRYCENKNQKRHQLLERTALIQKELINVGKLVVTEGYFSQVFTYEDSKKLYFDVLSARKKALVIVNAKVTVGYDLSKIVSKIDQKAKTVTISYIPKEEINIYPSIEYYDVTQDYLNQFDAKDYNIVKQRVDRLIESKINNSDLKWNAKNRLISELQKIYILTNTLGWTLKYNEDIIENQETLQKLKL
ncbi:MAG: hypothetical protein CVU03_01335 [Bacteroidetes bacterium HGW-Bacteroidetes-2]|nr:MAG: hypothetical protein CVU03_01335 [Bacteroidetes bacterium HGW-Bacteroidetes-2]